MESEEIVSYDLVSSFVAGELKSLSLPRGFPPEITVKEDDEGKERLNRLD